METGKMGRIYVIAMIDASRKFDPSQRMRWLCVEQRYGKNNYHLLFDRSRKVNGNATLENRYKVLQNTSKVAKEPTILMQ